MGTIDTYNGEAGVLPYMCEACGECKACWLLTACRLHVCDECHDVYLRCRVRGKTFRKRLSLTSPARERMIDRIKVLLGNSHGSDS